MVYARPSASDYDDWEKVYQNPGWGSKDLIPLLRKVGNEEGWCDVGSDIEEW
jgi:choline dehydrogenase-like flavoprotein